ncbi:unnamed protein product, partial [Ectocarpus fasciculatus]
GVRGGVYQLVAAPLRPPRGPFQGRRLQEAAARPAAGHAPEADGDGGRGGQAFAAPGQGVSIRGRCDERSGGLGAAAAGGVEAAHVVSPAVPGWDEGTRSVFEGEHTGGRFEDVPRVSVRLPDTPPGAHAGRTSRGLVSGGQGGARAGFGGGNRGGAPGDVIESRRAPRGSPPAEQGTPEGADRAPGAHAE